MFIGKPCGGNTARAAIALKRSGCEDICFREYVFGVSVGSNVNGMKTARWKKVEGADRMYVCMS
jgi:hypothetical protein